MDNRQCGPTGRRQPCFSVGRLRSPRATVQQYAERLERTSFFLGELEMHVFARLYNTHIIAVEDYDGDPSASTNASLYRRLIRAVLQSATSTTHPRITTKSNGLAQRPTHACCHHRPSHHLPVRLCRGRQPHLLRCSRSPSRSFLVLCAFRSTQVTTHRTRSLRLRQTPLLILTLRRLILPSLGQRASATSSKALYQPSYTQAQTGI